MTSPRPRRCSRLLLTLLAVAFPAIFGVAGQAYAAPDGPAFTAIKRVFEQLSDEQPTIRANALRRLMGLSEANLLVLADVVKASKPLTVEQNDALHDIVMQAYLAHSGYTPDGNVGFLGISFEPDQKYFEPDCGGVEVRHRLPGFCAYRYLEDGDVLLAVVSAEVEFELHGSDDIMAVVGSCKAGQVLTFKILRKGRIERVTLALNPRPLEANPSFGQTLMFVAERRRMGEAFWEEKFAPLVEERE